MIKISDLTHEECAILYANTLPQVNLTFTGLHRTFDKVTKNLLNLYGSKYKYEINVIVHNVATALKMKKSVVLPPRKHKSYADANKIVNKSGVDRSKRPVGFTKMMTLADKLELDGLIMLYSGGFVGRYKVMSRFTITQQFIDLFSKGKAKVSQAPAIKERDAVILRDKNGNTVPLPRGAKKEYSKDVEDLRKFMKGFDITWRGNSLEINLTRIFKYNMDNFGRFTFSAQNIKSTLRDEILINGECTVEWDLCSEHVSLCRTIANLPSKGKSFKPYDIDNKGLVVAPDGESPRKIYKLGMMCLLNTRGGAHNALRDAWKDLSNDATDRKKRGELFGYQGIENCVEIMRGLRERNKDVMQTINKMDAGTLQKLDSQIALEVMLELMHKGVCCLPYHDSFRVVESKSQDVQDAIFNAWNKVMGNTDHCYIEKK